MATRGSRAGKEFLWWQKMLYNLEFLPGLKLDIFYF